MFKRIKEKIKHEMGVGPRLIQTDRLILKPYSLHDFEPWQQARADTRPLLEPWEPRWDDDALTASSFERRVAYYLESWILDRGYSFLVWTKHSRALVGGVSLGRVQRACDQSAVLGYWCARAHQRQGYTHEAALALLNFGFSDLALHRIQASCMPDNTPSLNLLKKLGFRHEGLARGYLKIQDEWADHFILAKLNSD